MTQSDKIGLIACRQPFYFFITYVEIYRDFTEATRIVIGYTEIEIHIVKQEHVFSGCKPYFVRLGHIYLQKRLAFQTPGKVVEKQLFHKESMER